jgi:hypothetical protein
MPKTKTCSRCRSAKTATQKAFYSNTAASDGLSAICRACNSDQAVVTRYRRMARAQGANAVLEAIATQERIITLMREAIESEGT